MFFDKMLRKRIEELGEYRYRDSRPVSLFSMECDPAEISQINPQPPVNYDRAIAIEEGYRWKGKNTYWWIHGQLDVPADWQGRILTARFDFTRTLDNWMGFEALLFVNGKPVQALDLNHTEVLMGVCEGAETLSVDIRLWSGSIGPEEKQYLTLYRAEYGWLDSLTDDFYYLSQVMLDTIPLLSDSQYEKQQMASALTEAYRILNWTRPGSDIFYATVYKARDYLRDTLEQMPKTRQEVTVNVMGHTHIDMAWMWRMKHTREKGIRSFTTVNHLMDLYPEYIFMQSQPQLYDFIKQDAPELYEKIKARVAEGKWEPEGAMWVEPDCNLTSGESLTRQILLGQQFFEQEFGVRSRCLWLPDVFGYSWALPQILKKSGIDMFITSKISWNEYNKMPHELFNWKGIDGSEILTYFITTPDKPEYVNPDDEHGRWYFTYNGNLYPSTAIGTWIAFTDKNLTNQVIMPYGFGDGGGGVNRDMLERRRKLAELPGIPKIVPGHLKDFVDYTIHQAEEKGDEVPVWDGELYLEFHRGTYTSHAEIKRWNRVLEQKYLRSEFLSSVASVLTGNMRLFDAERLKVGWKKLLTNQFHDILPGSSIHDVYQDAVAEAHEANEIAGVIDWETISDIFDGNPKKGMTAINNTAWTMDLPIRMTCKKPSRIVTADGEELSFDWRDSECRFVVPQVPGCGWKSFAMEYGSNQEEVMGVEQADWLVREEENLLVIETPFYHMELNECGQISNLYDKAHDREVLSGPGNVFELYEDKPLQYDAWNIDDFHREKKTELHSLVERKVYIGKNQIHIQQTWVYDRSRLTQTMILFQKRREISFETTFDNHEKDVILKVAFPVEIRTSEATFDIQYGFAKRSTTWNTSWEEAKFESVGQRYADLSEYGYGVSLLNNCKYGYDVHDKVIRLSLLKSAVYPDPDQDQGISYCTYQLLPHAGSLQQAEVIRQAAVLNLPNTVVPGTPKYSLENASFAQFTGHEVELDALKISEDGETLVLRIHECEGGRGVTEIALHSAIKAFCEADLMENPIEGWTAGSKIRACMKPFEIKTFLLKI